MPLSPKELTAFRMAPEVMKAMREVKAKEGIPIAVQLDFAIRAWLKQKGIKVEVGTRERRKRPSRP
jgi:hypothetical protein